MSFTFRKLCKSDFDMVNKYMSRYGEGSCQHSFIGMYSHFDKYGDCICQSDGFLYVLRSGLENDDYRIYLAPMGEENLREAYNRIIDDAHSHGKKSRFQTLTRRQMEFVMSHFPGQFDVLEDRDYAEYIYLTEDMGTFNGSKYNKRRGEVKAFYRNYGDRVKVDRLCPDDFEEVLEYQSKWLHDNSETHDEISLRLESNSIKLHLENFELFQISGVVIRIDGEIKAYSYGCKLNDEYYDSLIEKADRDIPNLYKVIRKEAVHLCAMDCKYLNYEEDVGVEGLRKMKTLYHPEFLLDKYIVTEK